MIYVLMAEYSYSFVGPQDTTNKIDFNTRVDYSDIKFNNCLLYLEPRLQEYIKRKEYYKINGIDIMTPLEQTYSITPFDLMKIKQVLAGSKQKDCGFSFREQNSGVMGKPKCGNFQVSRFLKQEGNRFSILPTSQKPVMQPRNPLTSSYNRSGDNFKPLPKYNNSDNNNYRDISNVYTPDNFYNFDQYFYNSDPMNDWKQVSAQKPLKYRLTSFFSKDGEYAVGNNIEGKSINQKRIDDDTFLRPSYVDIDASGISRESYMDSCYKVVLPGGRNNSCYTDEYLNTTYYKAIPYMGSGRGQGDVGVETDMKSGVTTRFKQKKTGGEPLDRFEELDRDIQDPGHIVLPFPRGGVDTRAVDKWSKKDAQYVI